MGKYTYRPSKEEIQGVIIKLRWNGQTDPERIVGVRSYRQIAEITGKSTTYCRLVALNHLQALKKSPKPFQTKTRRAYLARKQKEEKPTTVLERHLEYIISRATLEK